VSQTPLAASGADYEAKEGNYKNGWAAISRLTRRGFSWSGHERNSAFLNAGDGSFLDVSTLSGFDFEDDGRALALLDWDLDGDLDLLVGNRNGPRVRFLENQSSVGGKTLELRSKAGKRSVIGARVELFLAGRELPLVREVRAGEGYLAQSSARLHFGTSGDDVKRVLVHWPAGESEEFLGDFAPTALLLVQGAGQPARLMTRTLAEGAALARLAPPGEPASAGDHAAGRVVLRLPVPLASLPIKSVTGQGVNLFGVLPGGKARGTGRPLLLNIWASWCAPCVQELHAFKSKQVEIEKSGIACLALSVDADEAAARSLMERVVWPWEWGFLPSSGLEFLDALQAALLDLDTPMPLPSSFLVDAEGMLRVIYRGPVDPEQLLLDKRLLTLAPGLLRDAAVPFPGTWWGPVPGGSLGLIEGKLRLRGLDDAAEEYARASFQVLEKSRAEMLYGFAKESASQGKMDAAVGYLRQAVGEDPGYFRAQFELAVLLHQRGELHAAIGCYLGALAADPEHLGSHFNLGLAYVATGQLGSAEKQIAWLKEHDAKLAKALEASLKAANEARQSPGAH